MKDYKTISIDLAQKAGNIMKKNFTVGMEKQWKKNDTPLTVTDTTINKLIINEIEKNFPTHSILGEEESRIKKSEYTWVCDPLDGTIPFSHGYPTFVFSLALTYEGKSIMGVIFDPIIDRMLYARKGSGAFLNNQKIKVSSQKKLDAKSMVNFGAENKGTKLMESIYNTGSNMPNLYSAVYASMLVAIGEFTAEMYGHESPWDGAAAKIIVEEAGGKVTDLMGNDQRYDRKINGFIASNGLVHDEILNICKKTL